MEKKRVIIWTLIGLLILGILIWGWIGANYKSAIPEERQVCDFGLMEELDVGPANIYLCWIWHTSLTSTEINPSSINNLFQDNS